MKLVSSLIANFRSIESSGPVDIESGVTVLVGQNESGKTSFLQALDRCNSVKPLRKFDEIEDYPRRYFTKYLREKTADNSPVVVTNTYSLTKTELAKVTSEIGIVLPIDFTFTVAYKYDGGKTISISVDEKSYVASLLKKEPLKPLAVDLGVTATLSSLLEKLAALDLNAATKAEVEKLRAQFLPSAKNWNSLLEYYLWKSHFSPSIPQFVYFDDYKLLPGKVNLNAFSARLAAAETNKTELSDQDSTVQSLLRMAGVDLTELSNPSSYETIKAKLEGFSNEVTDRVFKYWRQNKEIEVAFDIKSDPKDQAPFNDGNNLYIRITSRRHRVSMSFDRRSKGFIWFFSFIVWFSSVKEEVKAKNDLILLLDEPGLSLHALAQEDFLDYISELAEEHQVIYTTHSPFMVRSESLHEVRVVEDKDDTGTKISSNLSGSDAKTLFPLQAALGYTIAQNLFIAERNLLVEGPADLIILTHMSTLLDASGRQGLRGDVVVVPAGGLDKIATFVSLLGANKLQIAVLHDYDPGQVQQLQEIVKQKLIQQKLVRSYAEFRPKSSTGALVPSDLEDILPVTLYLEAFNAVYGKSLTKPAIESDLVAGTRIILRLNKWLTDTDQTVRATPGFNHYLVVQYLVVSLGVKLKTKAVLDAFEPIFTSLNSLYS